MGPINYPNIVWEPHVCKAINNLPSISKLYIPATVPHQWKHTLHDNSPNSQSLYMELVGYRPVTFDGQLPGGSGDPLVKKYEATHAGTLLLQLQASSPHI